MDGEITSSSLYDDHIIVHQLTNNYCTHANMQKIPNSLYKFQKLMMSTNQSVLQKINLPKHTAGLAKYWSFRYHESSITCKFDCFYSILQSIKLQDITYLTNFKLHRMISFH